jgi:hypothetical protein
MLSLAIGLNGTAFRVMNTMLFRGYPLVKYNERLLYLSERFPSEVCCISLYDFEQWRSQAHSFQGIALVAPKRISLSENNGGSREIWVSSMNYYTFRLLGVQPAMGRDFGPSDELPGAPPVVIASHRYWKTRLGGRGDVLSQTVRINGLPASIIGVMPEAFDFAGSSGIWLPLRLGAIPEPHLPYSADAFGRLADGASETGATRRAGGDQSPPGVRISGYKPRCTSFGGQLLGTPQWTRRSDHLWFLMDGRVVCVVDCLRQPGESRPGAGSGAGTRIGHADGLGRGACESDSSVAPGESDSCGGFGIRSAVVGGVEHAALGGGDRTGLSGS